MNDKNIIRFLKNFVGKATRSPVLGCILIKDGVASATNLDYYASIPLTVNLPNGCYTPQKLNAYLTVKSTGKIEKDFPVEEFPEDCIKHEQTEKVNVEEDFVDQLLMVSEFASPDAYRFILNGVFFEENKIVATNGKILVAKNVNLPTKSKVTIPLGSVKKLKGLACQSIGFSDQSVCFYCGELKIVSRIIHGNYPNYLQVIPKVQNFKNFRIPEFPIAVPMPNRDKENLAVCYANGKAKLIDKKNNIDYDLGDIALGDSEFDVNDTIEMNASFLRAAKQFTDSMMFSDSLSPLFFKDDNVTMALMPLRTSK